jgi:hypothetical protein
VKTLLFLFLTISSISFCQSTLEYDIKISQPSQDFFSPPKETYIHRDINTVDIIYSKLVDHTYIKHSISIPVYKIPEYLQMLDSFYLAKPEDLLIAPKVKRYVIDGSTITIVRSSKGVTENPILAYSPTAKVYPEIARFMTETFQLLERN